MTFGELRDDFKLKLNRRDITPTQVDTYIRQAAQRAQRLLRVPAMEARVIFYVGDDFTRMPIPGNYLKLVSLTYNDSYELEHVDLTRALQLTKYSGCPQYFSRDASEWIIAPKPNSGDHLHVVYYVDFSELVADTDNNWLTQCAPDVIVSGALSAALRTYVDPRRDSYEADFLQGIADLNLQANDDELVNASVKPMYSWDCD